MKFIVKYGMHLLCQAFPTPVFCVRLNINQQFVVCNY